MKPLYRHKALDHVYGAITAR